MQVHALRTVLVIPLEKQEGNNIKTPPRLMLVMPVEPRGSNSEMNPSIPKDEANVNCNKKSPGFPVRSTKVPETTLMDASVTYKQSVSQEMTNMKDLKTNHFKDSPTKTYNAERPDQPLQLACEIKLRPSVTRSLARTPDPRNQPRHLSCI